MEVVWESVSGAKLNVFDVHAKMRDIGIASPEARPIFRDPSRIIVKANDDEEVEALLEVDEVNGVPILAQPHRNKNANRCVIKCPSIAGLDPVRILTEMKEQGVTEVEPKGDTGTFILSFASKPPKTVKVGPLKVPTQHFVPRPILCRQCFCYGHTGEECTNKRACPKCAREHDGRCPGQPKCGNCLGKHLPTWGGCPVWKQEFSIRRLAVTKGVSVQAARTLYKKKSKGYLPLRRGTPAEPAEGVAGPSGTAPTPSKRSTTVVLDSDSEESALQSETEKPKKEKKAKKQKKK